MQSNIKTRSDNRENILIHARETNKYEIRKLKFDEAISSKRYKQQFLDNDLNTSNLKITINFQFPLLSLLVKLLINIRRKPIWR